MKKIYIYIYIVISGVFCSSLSAQIALNWTLREGSSSTEIPTMVSGGANTPAVKGRGVATDVDGNVYTVIEYGEIKKMGLYKHDKDGNLLWKAKIYAFNSKSINTTNIIINGTSIYLGVYSVDKVNVASKLTISSDRQYASSCLSNTCPCSTTPTGGKLCTTDNINTIWPEYGQGLYKAVVMKLNTSGHLEWVNYIKRVSYDLTNTAAMANYGPLTTSDSDYNGDFAIHDLAVDASGNLYFAGYYADDSLVFKRTSDADYTNCLALPRYTSDSSYASVNDNPLKPFWGKYDASGNLEWVKTARFDGDAKATGIAVEGNEVLIVGSSEGNFRNFADRGDSVNYDYPVSPATPLYQSNGKKDAFVFKYDATGSNLWYGKIGGTGDEMAYDISMKGSHIYTLLKTEASVSDSNSFQIGGQWQHRTSTEGVYIAKMTNSIPSSATGYQIPLTWLQGVEGSDLTIFEGSAMSGEADGDIFVVANQGQSSTYFNSPLNSTSQADGSIPTISTGDILYLKYKPQGNKAYIKSIGGTSLSIAAPSFGRGIAAYEDGFYTTGTFSNTMDFEPAPGVVNQILAIGTNDGFLAKYGCFTPEIIPVGAAYCINAPIDLSVEIDCPADICNYNYQWIDPTNGNSFQNSSNNLYSFSGVLGTNARKVIVTDGNTGCVTMDSIVIVLEPEVTIAATPSSSLVCYGTSVTFSAGPAVNGVALANVGYRWYANGDTTLLWVGPNFTTSAAGAYKVVADKNGCQAETVVVLNNYTQFSPIITPSHPTLCGGGAVMEVLDCPGCQYVWTPPASSAASSTLSTIQADITGRYRVDLTDPNGCQYIEEIDVISAPYLSPSITSHDLNNQSLTTICNGQPLTLSTTTCPTCTYVWSDGATGPFTFAYQSNTYQVTVTDQLTGCVGVSPNLNIQSSQLVTPQIQGLPQTICNPNPAVLSVSNSCSQCTYQWYRDNPNHSNSSSLINAATGISLEITTPADYFIEVTNVLGCTENSAIIPVGSGVATSPSIRSTTTTICNGNTATISTLACGSCSYQWYQYNPIDDKKIIISAIFQGSRAQRGQGPRGIEIYAIDNIADLSEYSIKVVPNGGHIPNLPPNSLPIALALPSRSLTAGTSYYLAAESQSFEDFFGFRADLINNSYHTGGLPYLTGNDAVVLFFQGRVIDLYGDTTLLSTNCDIQDSTDTDCYVANWTHHDGWVHRNDRTAPNAIFNSASWSIGEGNYTIGSTNVFWKENKLKIQEYTGTSTSPSSEDLVISAVFDSKISKGTRGIELYAVRPIGDLSVYGLALSGSGGTSPVSPSYNFPAVSMAANTYLYVTVDATLFNSFYLPSISPEVDGVVGNANGQEVISLFYHVGGIDSLIDQYGENSASSLSNWDYTHGWSLRKANTPSNRGQFSTANWTISPKAYLPTNGVFGNDSLKIGSFVPPTVTTTNRIQQAISGTNTSSYTTPLAGVYSVAIRYPNTCQSESEIITIEPSNFSIAIQAVNPDLGNGLDTTYICNGSKTGLTIQSGISFLIPPTWNYQWYREGYPITGATGFNYLADSVGRYTLKVINAAGCETYSNTVVVLKSIVGANPYIAVTPQIRCNPLTPSILRTLPYTGCSFVWRKARGTTLPGNSYIKSIQPTGGYYVEVTNDSSGCVYNSSIIEVRDTTYPAPLLQTSGNVICGTTNIDLIAPVCTGACTYIWTKTINTNSDSFSTAQNIIQTDTAANYQVSILYSNGCQTRPSNIVAATFKNFSAVVQTPNGNSICNNASVLMNALPSSVSTYTYKFQRNGITMQLNTSLLANQQRATQGGNYRVIVSNQAGCADTSASVTVQDIGISSSIQLSSDKICGPASCVDLTIDSCVGCSYQWYRGNVALAASRDTFIQACGQTAAGPYQVEITKAGCTLNLRDTLSYIVASPVVISIDSTANSYPTICGNTPVFLKDTCTTCTASRSYQWKRNGLPLSLAAAESYQADSAGSYHLTVRDTNRCLLLSNIITVQKFTADSSFALDFSPLGAAIPYTAATFSMDDYLQPIALRNNNTGRYTSLTANPAITLDSMNPSGAGAGLHIITFSYEDGNGNCTFSTFDSLIILNPMAMGITNASNSLAPANEACIRDLLNITLTNFTFIPDSILFTSSNNQTIALPLSIASFLTANAGVYSGTFSIQVPNTAHTGKVILKDNGSQNLYISPNFLAVQNPTASINLVGVSNPLCSSQDSIGLVGVPGGGTFAAHYQGQSPQSNLIKGDTLVVANISGYNTNGLQNVYAVYSFVPSYSNLSGTCPTVKDSLWIDIRDSELDSVLYSPISVTQNSESMDNLRRMVFPITAMKYAHDYTSTYVLANQILPSNTTIGKKEIHYQINNQTCTNTHTDSVELWSAPTMLDSIPRYLCESGDTVFIERTTSHLNLHYRGQLIYSDTLYRYRPSNKNFLPDFNYNEQLNLMEIYSSNGGLDSVNYALPTANSSQRFYFVPANVTGNSTTLTFRFRNRRLTTHLTASPSPTVDTIDYIVAEVSKNIIIERIPNVAINPIIVADTNFCPINLPIQFTGIPTGGQFYFGNQASNNPVAYDSLKHNGNNNIFNAQDYPFGQSYDLVYVYEGLACIDSAATGIYIPDPFAINLAAQGEYCESSPVDTISFQLLPPNLNHPIDTSSARFYVGGIQSSPYFSPVQTFASNLYNRQDVIVSYAVSDIYGCEASDGSTFSIYPLPKLAISFPLDTQFCLNNPATNLNLSVQPWWSASSQAISHPASYTLGNTASVNGVGVLNGGTQPMNPSFSPVTAGVGVHYLTYSYSDSLGCTDSIRMKATILPLPIVTLANVFGRPLLGHYCENDSLAIKGLPQSVNTQYFGYGYYSNVNNLPLRLDLLSQSLPIYQPNIPGISPGLVRDTLFYWFEIAATGCRDTAFQAVLVHNFTTDPSLQNYPDTICANNEEIRLTVNLNGGLSLNGLGRFVSVDSNAFFMPNLPLQEALFYPDSAGVKFASRNVQLTYVYSDTAGLCSKTLIEDCFVRALPELTLSEATYPNIRPLGTKLIAPNSDTLEHICEAFPAFNIYAYNQTGFYVSNQVFLNQPDLISPDTGTYNLSQSGVDTSGTLNSGSNLAFAYFPTTTKGLDTIQYAYTDAAGCSDTIIHLIVVDTIPTLSFAGLGNYQANIDRFVYCETDPIAPVILPSPVGVEWALIFNQDSLTALPFQLRPDTLAVANSYQDYPLDYYYIGQRYVSGAVCTDTLSDTIQIRPAPQLNWTAVPNHFCVEDSLQRFALSATPYGGQFIDQTFGVLGGIVGDSLFNPTAQAGKRTLAYYYLNPQSGCSDTILHTTYVYTKPQIGFSIAGGCQGNTVNFIPQVQGLAYNGVAIDSVSLVIWDFGDGVMDTITYLPDTILVPQDTHTYAGTGVFYPRLTVWNQGICDTTFGRRIVISPRVQPTDALPYVENFDASPGGWYQESADTLSVNGIVQDSLWEWGIANGQNLSTVITGNLVWGTRMLNPNDVTYHQGENAWVYSPCFDLSVLEKPMIQLSLLRNMQPNVDGAVVQYFDDSTATWKVLGKSKRGINWYQDGYVVASPGEQTATPIGWTGHNYVSGWENARYRLDNVGNDLRGRTAVRFRLAFASDPSTLQGVNEGILFDSVKIGNRRRHVLVEHFSGIGYPGIIPIEDQLYLTLFNNLYGRDVSLIQYHTNLSVNALIPGLETEPLFDFNPVGVRNRVIDYGITSNNQLRLNGNDTVSFTSDFINYPALENLDIESLKDPLFELKFQQNPVAFINSSGQVQNSLISITALEDINNGQFVLRAALTEDSIETILQHKTLAVFRYFLPDYLGTRYTRIWAKGDVVQQSITAPSVTIDVAALDLLNTEIVIFMQNDATKEVLQVLSSRTITQWRGPVDSIDVSLEDLPTLQEWEIINLKLYPNPAQDYFEVAFTQPLAGDYDWQLVDVMGRLLKSGKARQGMENLEVKTADLSAGMYIFTIQNQNIYTQRKVILTGH